MKTLRFALYLLMLSVFAACSSGSDDSSEPTPPQPDKPTVTFPAGTDTAPVVAQTGGTSTLNFTATQSWSASVKAASRLLDWISVSPTSGGAGNVTLKITTQPNDTPDERNAAITISSGGQAKTVTVSQKQKDALTVTSNKVELKAEGGNFTIEAKANVSVSYEIGADAKEWIKSSSSRGLTTTNLSFTAEANGSKEKRQGTILIKGDGGLSETVTVYQAGEGPTIVLTKNEYTVSSAGETITVELQSNVDVEVQKPASDWITRSTSRALSTHTYYFDIAPNEGYDNRTDSIFFVNKENGIKEKVVITQVQENAIIVAQNEYSVLAAGGALDFAVNTNVDFSVSVSVDWIKQVESRALTEKPLYFDIAENTSEEAREGKITITDGEIVQEIVVKQAAAVDYEAEEGAALIAFYKAAGGDNWLNKDNWCSDKPLNEWYGLTTDDGRVVKMDLTGNGLRGDIEEMIHTLLPLTELVGIYLADDSGYGMGVKGVFPEEFYRFTKLQAISIDYNLEGELTEDITQLSALTELNLRGVKVSPEVLKKICCSLVDLRYLGLDASQVNGSIPKEIGNLKKLQNLHLPNSGLTGELPDAMWKLPLIGWCLSYNPDLGGSISPDIQYMTELFMIDHKGCSLSGTIPNEITKCSKLSYVFLENNKLEGEIPADIGNLQGLERLWLTNNNLTGTLPVSLSKMTNLREFIVSGNRLSGEVPIEVSNMWNKWNPGTYILPQQEGYSLTYAIPYESADYSKDGEVLLLQRHTEGKGIPTILLGDAFVDTDMEEGGTYEQIMKRAMETYFSTEPMTSLRPLFDVYAVKCVSKNNYLGGNTALSCHINTWTDGETGTDDLDRIFEYASLVSENLEGKQIQIVMNDQQRTGVCYIFGDNCTVSFVSLYNYNAGENEEGFDQIFRHEAIGHGFGLLLDEYGHSGTATEEYKEAVRLDHAAGVGLNIDVTSDSTKILWNKFLFDERYKGEDLGIYEGAGGHYDTGVYRPSYYSIMRYNEPIFNAPSREAIYKRAMKLAYGDSWTYDYETFVKWDMEHYPTELQGRSVSSFNNTEWMKNHRPPVRINRTSAEILRQGKTVVPFR